MRNCDGKHPLEGESNCAFEFDPELIRCPHSLYGPQAVAYLAAWNEWKLFGVLPYPGDLREQPAHVYQAIRLIEYARLSEETRRARKAEEEHKR